MQIAFPLEPGETGRPAGVVLQLMADRRVLKVASPKRLLVLM